MDDLEHMLNDIKMEVELTRHLIGKDSLDTRVGGHETSAAT